jgi:D-alanyl-D-alanine carboxypeptidase
MTFGVRGFVRRATLSLSAALAIGAVAAQATPYLVVDADSDQVLAQDEATAPWYPASLTKLMTVYVALDAVRAGKLTLDTPLAMSARAVRMPPSKMGFRTAKAPPLACSAAWVLYAPLTFHGGEVQPWFIRHLVLPTSVAEQ